MAARIPANCKKFRPAIIPSACFLYLGGMLGLFCVIFIIDGLKVNLHALLFAAIVGAAWSFAVALLLALIYTASFSSDGLYGHSFWGTRRFAQWRDVIDARPFRLLNLQWLRIYTVDRQVTWLALFQSRKSEFRQEIERLAPDGNPILRHLR